MSSEWSKTPPNTHENEAAGEHFVSGQSEPALDRISRTKSRPCQCLIHPNDEKETTEAKKKRAKERRKETEKRERTKESSKVTERGHLPTYPPSFLPLLPRFAFFFHSTASQPPKRGRLQRPSRDWTCLKKGFSGKTDETRRPRGGMCISFAVTVNSNKMSLIITIVIVMIMTASLGVSDSRNSYRYGEPSLKKRTSE